MMIMVFRKQWLAVIVLCLPLYQKESWGFGFVPYRGDKTRIVSRSASLFTTDATETMLMEEEEEEGTNRKVQNLLSHDITTLPRHSHEGVNYILEQTEKTLQSAHRLIIESIEQEKTQKESESEDFAERVFANAYVDLGKVDIVGFDYDYTLVTYTQELLELIYEMALKRLVLDRQYPTEMLSDESLHFDPRFSIRGLAVDKETAWVCHLSYTHTVAVAWEGREKVPKELLFAEYRGKRALRPSERRERIKPLNDLFSMAECCLIADAVQFFKDHDIPFCPRNAVTDILSAIRETHISGDLHRMVAANPGKYFDPTPHLKQVLEKLKKANKRLIFVSNSPFWYVDAGMNHVIGPDWRDSWDAIVTSAGKPSFFSTNFRPFREVCKETGRIMFHKVEKMEKGSVYTEGCLKELIELLEWSSNPMVPNGSSHFRGSNVLYIGDSLFADLVDAKREYGWTTAAVTPEVGHEMALQSTHFLLVQRTVETLVGALRSLQNELGPREYDAEDVLVLDACERLVSKWRDTETELLGNPFGSVFRARFQPSLFAHSLRRYCDLYMSSVSSLRNYSPQHRFYPEDSRLLTHEVKARKQEECWDLDNMIDEYYENKN